MFSKITIHLSEPPCLCLQQNLLWTVVQVEKGPSLHVWCKDCGVKLVIPNAEFKAVFELERPYPGKKSGSNKVEVVERKPGDVIDFESYLKRRRDDPPS